MPKCPNCGSSRFHYELRSAGTTSTTRYYRTGIKKSWLIPSGRRSYSSKRNQVTVGICPDCGYTDRQQSQGGNGCATIIGIIIIIAIASGLFRSCSNTGLDTSSPGQTASVASETQSVNQIWATEYTPITDFKYYIDHDQITSKITRGKAEKSM